MCISRNLNDLAIIDAFSLYKLHSSTDTTIQFYVCKSVLFKTVLDM